MSTSYLGLGTGEEMPPPLADGMVSRELWCMCCHHPNGQIKKGMWVVIRRDCRLIE